jgi:uncharacterized caspase-like protein
VRYPANGNHVRILHDENATTQEIIDGLTWLNNCAENDPEATAIIYFSGHGLRSASAQYYLVTHDADPYALPVQALDARVFNQAIQEIPANACW